MKLFFVIATLLLALGSALLHWTQPGKQTEVPVIWWITQDDHYKQEIVTVFREWLREKGLPDVDLRIDNSNQDATKKLVQGVSGVGADLMDLYNFQIDLFPATGMMLDVTEEAKRLGFSPDDTYPALRPEITQNGRQYSFPRNTGVSLYWVNVGTFKKLGLPAPPFRWSTDEFEELGKRFVAAANPPGTRQRAYFVNGVSRDVMRRGLGLANFNETGTFCTLNDPRNVAVLERVRKWTVEDRLMPTREEDAAMAADISGSGSMFSHFDSGRFGLIYTGHWAFIMIRPRGTFELAAAEGPQDGFPNTELGGGAVGVYAGSKHREHAVRFLQYLGSDHFNRLIVRQADSLPPVPRYATTDEFLRPAGRENEWPVHQAFGRATAETGIIVSKSPFVLQSVVYRLELEIYESLLVGRLNAEQAAALMADRINAEIQLSVRRDPGLRALYEERVALQKRIEAKRAAGERVPAAWVTDAFHQAYYRAQGWLEEEAP
ncbi:MAG TPA: ABC transporter substrate-binding protein [Opitutaceae bacterium]|nr:ABC transporter substrate-binding protein [Opitutaceae bacterium]HRJ48761.1 ABC transporter substrate-binding protein [Opitutaceae bacterium]